MVFQGHQHGSRGCSTSLSWFLCWVISLALVGGVHPAGRRPRYVHTTSDISSRMRGSGGHRGTPLPVEFDIDDGIDSNDLYLDHGAITQEIDEGGLGLNYEDEQPGIIKTRIALNSSPEDEQHLNSHSNLVQMLRFFPSVVGTGYFLDTKRGTQTKDYLQNQEYDIISDNEPVQRPQVAKLVSLDSPKKKRGISGRFLFPGPTTVPKIGAATTKKAYPRSCLFYLKICKY